MKITYIHALLFLIGAAIVSCDEEADNTVLESGRVSGEVKNSLTKKPVEGVVVKLGDATYNTDSKGNYIFRLVEPAHYTITYTKDGYVTGSDTVTVQAVVEPYKVDILLVPNEIPDLGFSESSLMFTMDDTLHTVTITNSGEGTLTWSLDSAALGDQILEIYSSVYEGSLASGASQDLDIYMLADSLKSGLHSSIAVFTSNSSEGDTLKLSLNIPNLLPGTPVLDMPADAATGISVDSTALTWNPVMDPNFEDVTYSVYLDESMNPASVISLNSADTFLILKNKLADATTYYWRVVAEDETGATGESSAVRSFTTQ